MQDATRNQAVRITWAMIRRRAVFVLPPMTPVSSTQHTAGSREPIPARALILGWAGVIPFAGLSAVLLLAQDPTIREAALRGLPAYAAVILAFMGGVQWGLEMSLVTQSTSSGRTGYAMSVLPALLAAAALLLAPRNALLILAAGFAALLAYDLKRAKDGIGPKWYPRLRIALTGAVLASLTAAIYALRDMV